MRFSRTNRAVLVVLFIGLFGAFGPALDGTALTALQTPVPSMEGWLDFESQTFTCIASGGMPGTIGLLNFLVVTGAPPTVVSIPIPFNGNGDASFTLPVQYLDCGVNLIVGIQLIAVGWDGAVHGSPLWALTTHNYVVTDPQVPPCPSCPTEPGEWVDYVTWPGTNDPSLFPHTKMAIITDENRLSGQPMLALESGPAGSFPIN
jgi:hypothetical protein